MGSTDDYWQRVDGAIRALRSWGLDAEPLDAVVSTAFTSSSELMGELGLALRAVRRQRILDPVLERELDALLAEVRKIWPRI